MASKTEIANLAISHLGVGKEISNLDTEQSPEATACRRFYEIAKENVLSDAYWSFAKKRRSLSLVQEDPNDEWDYSYRYPQDCLEIRRIPSGFRQDTQASRVKFELSKDSSGRLIYTDRENAELVYTENIIDTELFSPEFTMALSYRLAWYTAPRLSKGDLLKMRKDMISLYELEIEKAKKKNMNEEVMDQLPESETIRSRESGTYYDTQDQYVEHPWS